MHDIEEIILKPMIGRSSKKFWYTVSAFSLLWLSLFYFHISDLKNHNSQISLLKNNFIDTYESNSVLENGISIEKGIKSTRDDDKESQAGNPIDNFFIGGDWDKYLDEASKIKKKLKKPKPDNQIHLTKNEAKSINDVFGRGNVQESRNLDSVSVEKEKMKEEIKIQPTSAYGEGVESDAESCSGRYIYMHELPSQFNEDLLKHCGLLSEWTNMCIFVSNFGFGPSISNSTMFSKTGWFETNQFMLEVIFHNRMKEYRCLTNDSSRASGIFVPYYSGLDVARFLWDSHSPTKDYNPASLVKWLREKPEWKKLWGRDHFMVAGRVSWDFRRPTNETSDWGNRLMVLPESKNMTFLTIESSPWNENDFAIPYPSYFHPSTDNQIYTWQNRMKRIRRQYLFSFAGAPRPKLDTIRREIIKQCKATRRRCKMLNECDTKGKKCYNPVYVMQTFQNSIFCLQPPGDSYTRRSTFDSILAGCIPVFFHPGSAYVQYLWHLPKDYTKYSVFIPENEVKNGKASIEKILSKIPKAKRLAMREQVIKLIPGIVYADPTSSLETLEDAFDITIDGVLERFEQIRNDTRNGKNLTLINQQEEFTWKKNLFGTVKKHEWDPLFKRSF